MGRASPAPGRMRLSKNPLLIPRTYSARSTQPARPRSTYRTPPPIRRSSPAPGISTPFVFPRRSLRWSCWSSSTLRIAAMFDVGWEEVIGAMSSRTSLRSISAAGIATGIHRNRRSGRRALESNTRCLARPLHRAASAAPRSPSAFASTDDASSKLRDKVLHVRG